MKMTEIELNDCIGYIKNKHEYIKRVGFTNEELLGYVLVLDVADNRRK